jgi:hypothetical protein
MPLPDGVEGGNIAPLFAEGEGSVKRPNEALVFHFPHYQSSDGPHSSIRNGDFKLIKFYETGELCLFDLANDIGERNSLAKEEPEKAADLHGRMQQHLRSINASLPAPNAGCDPAKVQTGSQVRGKQTHIRERSRDRNQKRMRRNRR